MLHHETNQSLKEEINSMKTCFEEMIDWKFKKKIENVYQKLKLKLLEQQNNSTENYESGI